MSSNSQEKNDSSSSDEEIRRRFESKNISGQKLDSEDATEISYSDSGQAIATNEKLMNTSTQDICTDSSDDTWAIPSGATEDKHEICQTIDLSQTQTTQDVFGTGADSGQAIATNEKIMNTSTQDIISDYSSDDTMPIPSGTTEDYGSEDNHNICQTLDLNQTQATQDLFGTGADTELPPKLTRGYAGIYMKPFISSQEHASTSCQHQQNLQADNIETTPQEQDNLQADAFPILKFGPRPDNWNEYLSQKIAWTFAPSPGLGPDSYIKKAKREYDIERERERERGRV